MPGRAVLTLLVLAGLLQVPAFAGDVDDAEVPVLPRDERSSPPPSAPPRPIVTRRSATCPPVIRLKRVPVYEEIEVPVTERRTVLRYREIQVPVFKNRRVPVYGTRRVPVYESSCVLRLGAVLVPRFELVRCQTGWREERWLRGERIERVRCGVRPQVVCDGVEEREVRTGVRTQRRLVGWRAEPSREGPACGVRVGEGVLKPCAR